MTRCGGDPKVPKRVQKRDAEVMCTVSTVYHANARNKIQETVVNYANFSRNLHTTLVSSLLTHLRAKYLRSTPYHGRRMTFILLASSDNYNILIEQGLGLVSFFENTPTRGDILAKGSANLQQLASGT